MKKSAKLLLFMVVFVGCALNSNNIFAQTQNTSDKTMSITSTQYERWVEHSGKNLLSMINNIVVLSDDQKNSINKDLQRVAATQTSRPDLSAINGIIIARESFKMISKHLTQEQNDKLSLFNAIKN